MRKTKKKKTSNPPEIGIGDLLSVLSALSNLNRADDDDESDYRPARRGISGVWILILLACMPGIIVTFFCYVSDYQAESTKQYEAVTEPPEVASPTRKQKFTLVKDVLFKDVKTFKDDYGYEIDVIDNSYCVVGRENEYIGGQELELVIWRNADAIGCRNRIESFIAASKAAVGG